MACWSSGMIPASGAGGPGFNSQTSPLKLLKKLTFLFLIKKLTFLFLGQVHNIFKSNFTYVFTFLLHAYFTHYKFTYLTKIFLFYNFESLRQKLKDDNALWTILQNVAIFTFKQASSKHSNGITILFTYIRCKCNDDLKRCYLNTYVNFYNCVCVCVRVCVCVCVCVRVCVCVCVCVL